MTRIFTSGYPSYVARFYDVIYSKVISGEDSGYYLEQILKTQGPVLELGVGTGRIFVEALKQGADIFGIDANASMIEVLKKKIEKKFHHRVKVQDAVNLNLNNRFNLIMAPFRVFSHFVEVIDQFRVLNAVFDHLHPQGQFIFDVFIPNLKLITEGIKDLMDFDGEYEKGKKLKRITSMEADPLNQVSHLKMKYVWEENEKEIEKEWAFPMRYFFKYELEHLIARSRLTLVNIFGDYQEHPLDANSQEFVLVCQKCKK
jgi:ubiquinone/menaquinone biosynthesis C-methylase UbiE